MSSRRRPGSTSVTDTGLRRCDGDWGHEVGLPGAAMGDKVFFIYLLASGLRGTLYVGVTSDLLKRVWQHKTKTVRGFTARYGVDRVVWFESHATAEAAITREKQLKEWKRDWKMNLIERDNPHWIDLYPGLGTG